MKVTKRIAWILLMLLTGLVVAAMIVPILFKDDIVEKLKITANDQLNAIVDFDDVNISIIASFPNASIDIVNLSITGIEKYEGINLYSAKHTMLDLSLPSLIKEDIPYQLREVIIDNAQIKILRSADGTSNYEITKTSDGNATNYTLELEKYEINNSKLSYIDNTSNLSLIIDKLDHKGSGRFTEKIYDLNTYSKSGKMTVISDGIKYINNATANLDATINIDLPNEKYTLKNNKLTINELNLDGVGYVQINNDNIYIDALIKGLEDNFRSYLSVIPNAYIDELTNVTTEGKGAVSVIVKGNYNSLKTAYPFIDIDLDIANAFVKYNNMPNAIENISASIHIDAGEGDYSDLTVNIPTLKASVANDSLEVKLLITDSTRDPKVKGKLFADIDLRNWKSAIPTDLITDMNGSIVSDFVFSGRVSDIEAANYQSLTMDGKLKVNDMNIKRTEKPDISIAKALVKASPEKMELDIDGIKYGKSHMDIFSSIENPLMLAINNDQSMIADIEIIADNIDANELIPSEENTDESIASESMMTIDDSKINLTTKIDRLVYTDQEWKNINLVGQLDGDNINLTSANAMLKENDISLTGYLRNPLGFMDGNKILTGKINIESNTLDMNDFMSESSEEVEAEVFIIPQNVDIDISATIKNLVYTNMNMYNSTAFIKVEDQTAEITSFKTNTLGGEITMRGAYDSNDVNQPLFNMMLDLNNIVFVKAFDKMQSVQKLAPIAKYISGNFNSTLTFAGTMSDQMIPDLSTLNASGFVETFASSIKDFSVLKKLGNKLGIEELKTMELENTKNWFEVINGTVELKPRQFKVKNIDIAIAGKHGYAKDMNYFVEMKIPREMLIQNVVIGILDQGITELEAKAAKYGLQIGDGDFINLDIGITGSMQSPKYSIKPVGYESGGIKQAINDEIDNQIEMVKDSVKTVINDTKQTIKDSANTVINEVIDSAKTIVDTKVNEVKDSIKTILNNQVDSIATQAGLDSLRDKVKNVIGIGADKEVNKIKDKIKGWNPFGKKKKKNN